MSLLLAIDPGIDTGYAVLEEGVLIDLGVIRGEDIKFSKLATYAPIPGLSVVIERVPTPTLSAMNVKLGRVITQLHLWFPEATWIHPGEWKNGPYNTRGFPVPGATTAHERDAYRMALYYAKHRARLLKRGENHD